MAGRRGALVLIAVSVCGFAYSAKGFWRFRHLVRHGVETEAVIDQAVEEEVEANDGRDAGLITIAWYSFVVRGQTYGGRCEGALGRWQEGEIVDVQYDPDDPTQNRLADDRGVAPADVLVVALISGLLGYAGVAGLKHASQSQDPAPARGSEQP